MAKLKFVKHNPQTSFKIADTEEHLNKITNLNHIDTIHEIDDSNWDKIRKETVILELVDGEITYTDIVEDAYNGRFAELLQERINLFKSWWKGNPHIYDEEWDQKFRDYISNMKELLADSTLHVDNKTFNEILSENGKSILCHYEVAF
jgi:hypothetical protein